MTLIDARRISADADSEAVLAAQGLMYRQVDPSDAERTASFQRAMSRGFLGAEPTPDALAFGRRSVEDRRSVAVYDIGLSDDVSPVATIDSWVTPLVVPGGARLPMWAISGVTVAATHRRRGIARALLEGELRSAASAGAPIAGLTVSEATIYGRYGFGSALPMTRVSVDTRRAGWRGPRAAGRLEFVDRAVLAADLGRVHERARLTRPGQIPGWEARWEGIAGLDPSDTDRDKVRGVRYLDAAGELRGVLAYSVDERAGSFRFALQVRLLVAETPEATVELWRFAVQHDLVDEVTADLRPIDDPLPWLVADLRGVTQVVHDHGWLRLLDLPAALGARRYGAPLDIVIRVEDPLGFTAGDWRLTADADRVSVVRANAHEEPDVELDVSALSIIYAGGVRAGSLHAAGRITADPSVVGELERAFLGQPAPALDIWY